MEQPEHFELLAGYAAYRPVAQLTFAQGVELVSRAIVYCREQKIRNLLVNTLGLGGFDLPGTFDRYAMGEKFASAASGAVRVAFVAREELIDPRRFGLTVARNRGLISEAFTEELAALEWLTGEPTD